MYACVYVCMYVYVCAHAKYMYLCVEVHPSVAPTRATYQSMQHNPTCNTIASKLSVYELKLRFRVFRDCLCCPGLCRTACRMATNTAPPSSPSGAERSTGEVRPGGGGVRYG